MTCETHQSRAAPTPPIGNGLDSDTTNDMRILWWILIYIKYDIVLFSDLIVITPLFIRLLNTTWKMYRISLLQKQKKKIEIYFYWLNVY